MKTKLIVFGLTVTIFTGSLLSPIPLFADSLFQDALKLGGAIYQKTGEAMEELGEKNKDTSVGKGLKMGGKIHKSIGTTMEKTAKDMDEPKRK